MANIFMESSSLFAIPLVACNYIVFLRLAKGLFTWREKDPSTKKILEGETNFRLDYMQKFRLGWLLEIK